MEQLDKQDTAPSATPNAEEQKSASSEEETLLEVGIAKGAPSRIVLYWRFDRGYGNDAEYNALGRNGKKFFRVKWG